MPVRLFVGNLSYEATEAELREHFGTVGPVTYCYLPTDRETGRMRGFAFVEYADDSHAHAGHRSAEQPGLPGASARREGSAATRKPAAGCGTAPVWRTRHGRATATLWGRPGRTAAFLWRTASRGRLQLGTWRRPGSRERNFGPDAPPKGKRKPTFNRKDQQGPKGPIRTKTDNRIYSAFGDDEDKDAAAGVPGEFDDFATSLGPDAPDEE